MSYAIVSSCYKTENFFNPVTTENTTQDEWYKYLLLSMMTVYIVIKTYGEFYEFKSKCCAYFLNVSNLFDFLLLVVLVGTVLGSL